MPKVRVAVSGGGIAALSLIASVLQLDPTAEHIDIHAYESSPEFVEVGAGITLWGRVCEALEVLGLANDCIKASVIVASTDQAHSASTGGFLLRECSHPHQLHGKLPFQDAWSLHRADLLRILLQRVPRERTHLNKRVTRYECSYSNPHTPITIYFADGTSEVCDILIGADGLRSVVRGQMMRDAAATGYTPPSPGKELGHISYARHARPVNSGTIAYRSLVDASKLRARNPDHPMLSGPQIYLGVSKHVVGYPISSTKVNLAVNITPRGVPFGPPTSPTSPTSPTIPNVERARTLNRSTVATEVVPHFPCPEWSGHVEDLLASIDEAIEWPILDIDPLPFYARGRVCIIGDAAHATVPYLGAGAAFAIEDGFILSRALYATATCAPPSNGLRQLDLALKAFQEIRQPYGNRLISYGRTALQEFQLCGPSGGDVPTATASIIGIFKAAMGVDSEDARSGPRRDAERVVEWFRQHLRGVTDLSDS